MNAISALSIHRLARRHKGRSFSAMAESIVPALVAAPRPVHVSRPLATGHTSSFKHYLFGHTTRMVRSALGAKAELARNPMEPWVAP